MHRRDTRRHQGDLPLYPVANVRYSFLLSWRSSLHVQLIVHTLTSGIEEGREEETRKERRGNKCALRPLQEMVSFFILSFRNVHGIESAIYRASEQNTTKKLTNHNHRSSSVDSDIKRKTVKRYRRQMSRVGSLLRPLGSVFLGRSEVTSFIGPNWRATPGGHFK